MKLVYVAPSDVSVYESQVLELLKFLHQEGIDVTILQGYVSESDKANVTKKLFNYPFLNVVWVHNYTPYPFFKRKTISNFYNGLKQIKGWETAVIHIRGEFLGYIFKEIAKKYLLKNKIIIDMRAVVLEEMIYRNNQSIKRNIIRKIKDKVIFKYTKSYYSKLFAQDNSNIYITSVSEAINKYIITNYPKCKYPLFVNYNIAGNQFVFSSLVRTRIREELNLNSNDILAVCSSGGSAMWQKDYLVAKHLVDLGIKVLFLAKKDPNISGCVHRFVPFQDMPAYLSAADISVLWRENTFMNNSASPSKFSEFAVMGVCCIHNNSVEVAINNINKLGVGLLVNDIEEITIDKLQNIDFSKRAEWINDAKNVFSVDAIGRSYMQLYNS